MGFYRCTQESQNAHVGQKSYGDRFWKIKGVIYIDYLQIGETITGQYYSELLDRFHIVLKQKRSQLKDKDCSIKIMQSV